MPAAAALYAGPAAFQLPTVVPDGLIAECGLRFTHVRFERTVTLNEFPPSDWKDVVAGVKRARPNHTGTPPWDCAVLRTADGATRVGASHIIDALSYNTGTRFATLTTGLTNGQFALTDAVIALLNDTIFPAVEFACYGPNSSFAQLAPKLRAEQTWLQHARNPAPVQRRAKLEHLKLRHGIASEADAVAALRRGFTALERFLTDAGVTTQSSAAAANEERVCPFFHGTAAPSKVDCYVFAAVAMACGARFPADSAFAEFQLENNLSLERVAGSQTFPLVNFYASSVSLRYFEQYSGLHFLNIPRVVSNKAEDEQDVYRQGRVRTVVATAVFGVFYFLVVHAPTIVAILAAAEEDEEFAEEDGDGFGLGEAPAGDGEAVDQQQQRTASLDGQPTAVDVEIGGTEAAPPG